MGTNSSGSRNYKLWIPAGYTSKKKPPLVMMLHGCTQSPDDFATAAQMNVVADKQDFLVVYPEQTAAANVFQGAKDGAVVMVNAEQVVTQWTQTNDYIDDGTDNDSVDDIADNTNESLIAGGYAFAKYVYNDRKRKPLMEKWMIADLKHAWSGGAEGASYTDPKGPNASQEMWRFFRETQALPSRNRSDK